MPFEMIDSERTILIFNLDVTTGELVGSETVYVAPGTGLPADSTDLQPPVLSDGYARVFDTQSEQWLQVEDHRGQVVYHKETLESGTVSALGPLLDTFTLIVPTSQFDKWDGNQWVKDDAAEKQMQIDNATALKKGYIENANVQIQIFSDAAQYGMATKGESLLLKQWQIYRVQLNRISPSSAPDIEWPGEPASATDEYIEEQAEQAELAEQAEQARAAEQAELKANIEAANALTATAEETAESTEPANS